MAELETVLYATDRKGVATITLHRPKTKNAFNAQMYVDLVAALERAESDDNVVAVIITGTGSYFSSGADIKSSSFDGEGQKSVDAPVGRFMLKLLTYPKLVIAAVNGPAVGVGVTMVPHCDLAFASTSATFWTPFVRIAVVPEFCSSVLFPRIMGRTVANEMLLAGERFTAQRALHVGLVSKVLDGNGGKGSFMEQVTAEVHRIVSQPLAARSLPLFKSMIQKWDKEFLVNVCKDELSILDGRLANGDTMEAVMMLLQENMNKKKKASKL
eukprot:TRINITY_DN16830_c0_g1_i1.p1 TRINITY_DN16830_c0_g1~~TRINITY_DN16830_c0_g1_i1.p1  ORF type:complete len:270 (-),score=62.41 TRINITY_DN16830_c0_g1_i1:75-884(-)